MQQKQLLRKPIAVTMGDANGVGPEIILRFYTERGFQLPTVVYGDFEVLNHGAEILGLNIKFNVLNEPVDLDAKKLNVLDLGLLSKDDLQPGKISKETGAAAYRYVEAATESALDAEVAGLVTLPVNKEATQLTYGTFTGHTDMIARICGTSDYAMMLATDAVAVSHVSAHVSLIEAIRGLNSTRVHKVIELTHSALSSFLAEPRIAVCGLNPHAGEHGMFGDEEEQVIAPALERCQSKGWLVSGPHPADTVFHRAIHDDAFDAIICMYHDQGHAPMKLYAFHEGVNVTIGLPIVRTSVDHGTAFDIAWQGKAFTDSFGHALNYAEKLLHSEGN